jgi:integrase
MALTELQLRALRAKPAPGKHGDKDGLFLRVTTSGTMLWQWRLRAPAGETTVSYGGYPEVGLARARELHRAARDQVREGIHPNEAKRAARKVAEAAPAATFEAVARDWFKTRRDEWAPSYADRLMRRLERDVFPWLGATPIASVTPPQLLEVLRRIEARGVIETAHRIHEHCSQVFRYAVAAGLAPSNPARDLKDALRKAVPKHFPAVTDPKRLGEVLRAFDGYRGSFVVRCALRLLPMLLLRPGELRHMQWAEIDLDAATLTVPAARMKRVKAGKLHGKPHVVPLSTQAVAVLRELHPLTGQSIYVFRGERHHERPMSDSTLVAAMRAMGIAADETVAHGFRATARTLIAEKLSVPEQVIEAQLAHSVRDALGTAYNRTEWQEERSTMMHRWADYLDRLRRGADVVELRSVAA